MKVAVAVKTLKVGSSIEEKVDFLSEAEMMKRFDHKVREKEIYYANKYSIVCFHPRASFTPPPPKCAGIAIV